jgi:DNA invertase Pin-like site-specific DNA recombinase
VTESAGLWVRVSTGGQDEANQVPDVERHCQTHGYRIARRYELNDKSASKGEQQDMLDRMLNDMREGTIRVLVCWHSDRLERRGPEYVFPLLARARDAGGRIESAQQPTFGQQDFAGQVTTAVNAAIDWEKSHHLSEQVTLAHNRSRANDAIYAGTPLFGFTIEGPKYHKKYVPTDLGRKIVPEIYDRCIDGQSLRQIAEWLDSLGIPTTRNAAKWNESVVRRIIRNMAYAGRVQNREGVAMSHCEAIVPMPVWKRANEALRTRPKRGPAKPRVNVASRPLLAKLKCNRCGSPMYRRCGGDGGRYHYYACAGSGPQRQGCGNVVAFDHTENIVADRIFMTSQEPYTTRRWIEGENWEDEIARVTQDVMELPRKVDPLSPEFAPQQADLFAKLAECRRKNEDAEPGSWDKTYTRRSNGRVVTQDDLTEHPRWQDDLVTVGEHFRDLDRDGQREYLQTRDIRVERAEPWPPGTRGVRVVIDGEDHGVFAYPGPRREAWPREEGTAE